MAYLKWILPALAVLFNVDTSMAAKSGGGPDLDNVENWRLTKSIIYSWTAIVVLLMGYTFYLKCTRYIRTAVNSNSNDQRYFAIPNRKYGLVKKYLTDAPLFRKRHHREFMISKAVNVGTLPSRAQALFLVAYLVMAITLTTYHINWKGGKDKILAQILKRTGFMALVNMLPLFLLAG